MGGAHKIKRNHPFLDFQRKHEYLYMKYNTEFCYVFKQCNSKYREVPLITLGCRSPDLWKVVIYNCSLFDKWSVGCWFFCLLAFVPFFKKKKTIWRKKKPSVYNGLVVRILTHRAKELDFKPFSDWWGSNPQTNVYWDSAPTIWLSSILDDRVKSTFHRSSWSCFLPLWGKEHIRLEKEHARKPDSVT